jgi:hypothetical protein
MQRTPNPSDTLIPTLHLPRPNPPILPPIIRQQQLRLDQNLTRLHISDTNGLFAAIEIMRAQHGMFVGARRDAEFDGGRRLRELGEGGRGEEVVHPPGGAGPVTVVQVDAAAGEEEGA